MTIDEITEKMECFNREVRDRIDELMLIESRVDERVSALKRLHQQMFERHNNSDSAHAKELENLKSMLSKFAKQHDDIIHTIAVSKDFVAWSRRVLIFGASIALAVLLVSGYGAYKWQGYIKDARLELADLESQITKTPVIYKNENGADVVRVKTTKEGKVRWSNEGKHKGAYAEIEYAK